MKAPLVSQDKGSVMVLTAFAMFPIMFLLAFVIDVSHWFDYSRNLQNRADAAALAAGGAFGNICLEGGTPGTPQTGPQSVIGKWAQLYSGAGVNEPLTPQRLPYTDAAVAAGTGWNVATNGYINNTKPASSMVSPLTLKAGNLSDYYVVLNGTDYAENGGTSFTMKPSGTGATFCNSDPTQDLTDPSRASAGPAGAMVDVKVSQRSLPLFFQGLFPSIHPNIHAHARVTLQGEASTASEPIAVSDTGYTPCLTVYFKSTADNSTLGTAVLTKRPQVNQTDPIVWENAAVEMDSSNQPIPNTGPTPVSMPTDANVYIQPYLNTCNGNGQLYDGDKKTGVLYINSHPQNNPTVGTSDPPALTPGGVFLQASSCTPDQYFSVGDCTDVVNAYVKFDPGITPLSKTQVSFVDNQWDPTANNGAGGFVASAPVPLHQDNSDPTHWFSNTNPQLLTVPDESGIHEIEITWEQQKGSITGKGGCDSTSSNPCKGSFGIQTQAFSACNGCDQPDDSGPIISARLRRSSSGAGVYGENSFTRGTTQSLVVTLQLSGLSAAPANAGPADDTILRYAASSNHQTGLVDCGQGPSNAKDQYVVYGGCGPSNPFIATGQLPAMNPIFGYSRPPGSDCSPAADGNTTGWPGGNHQDCVATTPGQRTIICPLILRITGEPITANCSNNSLNPPTCAPGTSPCCPSNAWPNVQGGDPRAVTMIITSGADLNAVAGSPQAWIPVRRFATFYITGWDTRVNPQCSGNDAFPGKGKLRNQQNGSVWGHWMNYTDPLGIGDNQNCPINSIQPINCVPVLTR